MQTKQTRDAIRATATDQQWELDGSTNYYDHLVRDHEHLIVYYCTRGGVVMVAHHYASRMTPDGEPIYEDRFLGPWTPNKLDRVTEWLGQRSMAGNGPEPLFTQN